MGQSPITSHCDVLLFSFLFIKNQYFHSTHPSVRRTTGATDIYIYISQYLSYLLENLETAEGFS